MKCIVHDAEGVLTASNDVLSGKFTVYFWSFSQQMKAKIPSPNGHAWQSIMTQFALPICQLLVKLKPRGH